MDPLLFLDVDGTLLPFNGPEPDDWDAWQHPSNPALATLDLSHGPRLRALPCSLVWATAWMDDANTVIAPLLGLPPLPVASFPDDDEPLPASLHWKTAALVSLAAGRPFAWVDDEIKDFDRLFVEHQHQGPALLHRVDPATGLTAADFDLLDSWLRNH